MYNMAIRPSFFSQNNAVLHDFQTESSHHLLDSQQVRHDKSGCCAFQ